MQKQFVVCYNDCPGFTLPLGTTEDEALVIVADMRTEVSQRVHVHLQEVPTEPFVPQFLKDQDSWQWCSPDPNIEWSLDA